MVIHEKALVQEMKQAYKGWGYTVIVRPGDKWVFKTDSWTVQIDGQANVPREALALIVLHMGELPKKESACRIYKVDTGPAIQKEVFAVANETIEKLEALARNSEQQQIHRTKLSFGVYRVWQKEEDMEIFLMDPNDTRIIDSKEFVALDQGIYAEGDISWAFALRRVDSMEKTHIDHLAQMQWVQK